MDAAGNPTSAVNSPATPEVYYGGEWYPICGYYFFDNNVGATTFCKMLGFDVGTVQGKEKIGSGPHFQSGLAVPTYNKDAMPVGVCTSPGQALTECTAEGGKTSWGNLDYSQVQGGGKTCKKGERVAITVTCTGGDKTRTASCGEGKHAAHSLLLYCRARLDSRYASLHAAMCGVLRVRAPPLR